MDLKDFFTRNISPRQKQYEALRAIAFKEGQLEEIALRFKYTVSSLRVLISKLYNGQHILFPSVKRGPRKRRLSEEIQTLIYTLRRKKRLNSQGITEELRKSDISVGVRTVERILSDAGFPRLHRRSYQEMGMSKKGNIVPARAQDLDISTLQPFRAECQVAGVFFFLPYLIESGVLDIIGKIRLPESNDIGKRQAALSMLLLKILGKERLSHIDQYNTDNGFGIFAGLNVLPKPTYMMSYSCRTSAKDILIFQKETIDNFCKRYPHLYESKTINLDFHSIPHFGEESGMEKVWCGSRNKTMKGANTFFAQAGEKKTLLYTRTDIKRKESSEEIQRFIDFWIDVKGVVEETLVFDCKLTRYDVLRDLDERGIKFITIRRKSKELIEKTREIPQEKWQKVYLNIPKRKYKRIYVHESQLYLKNWRNPLRQIIMKDHGRAEPSYVITNNRELKIETGIEIYGRRWRIENKLSELVKFFNINSLSSPLMIRIHFDLLWTIIADTLYHIFTQDLRRFETCLAPKIFRNFVDMPGIVEYNGKEFVVKIRKRANTPILLSVEKLQSPVRIPWLGNRPLRITWTA